MVLLALVAVEVVVAVANMQQDAVVVNSHGQALVVEALHFKVKEQVVTLDQERLAVQILLALAALQMAVA
jgi:hypothetical protein